MYLIHQDSLPKKILYDDGELGFSISSPIEKPQEFTEERKVAVEKHLPVENTKQPIEQEETKEDPKAKASAVI